MPAQRVSLFDYPLFTRSTLFNDLFDCTDQHESLPECCLWSIIEERASKPYYVIYLNTPYDRDSVLFVGDVLHRLSSHLWEKKEFGEDYG